MLNLPFRNNTFHAIFSTHDSINYLTTQEIKKHFKEIKRVLKPNGIYLFDVSTEFNIIENFHNRKIIRNIGEYTIEWDNHYDFTSNELISTLLFKKRKNKIKKIIHSLTKKISKKNIYNKKYFLEKLPQIEIHKQQIYSQQEIIDLIHDSQLNLIESYSDYKRGTHKEDAQLQIYIIQK